MKKFFVLIAIAAFSQRSLAQESSAAVNAPVIAPVSAGSERLTSIGLPIGDAPSVSLQHRFAPSLEAGLLLSLNLSGGKDRTPSTYILAMVGGTYVREMNANLDFRPVGLYAGMTYDHSGYSGQVYQTRKAIIDIPLAGFGAHWEGLELLGSPRLSVRPGKRTAVSFSLFSGEIRYRF